MNPARLSPPPPAPTAGAASVSEAFRAPDSAAGMRIAMVCADAGVPLFGSKGCSIHVQEVARALGRRGADIEVFCTRPGGSPPADLAEIRLHEIPLERKGGAARRELAGLAANAPLRRRLERSRPDIVYERYSLWSCSAMEYAAERGIPGLLEVNAPLIEEQIRHRTLVHREAAERVARKAFACASSLLAVSERLAEHLEEYPEARGKVRLVPNGVDPARFLPRRRPGGLFTAIFVGSLKPWHGLDLLIDVFAGLRADIESARLLIVGDGPQRAQLQRRVENLALAGSVSFEGAVPADRIPLLLASADVGVAPYPRLPAFYFSPLKVLEYMAAGLAVVTSETGQLRTLIQDEANGLLYPPGDPSALAGALERLALSPRLRSRLGEAARLSVLTQHTWDQRVGDILAAAEAPRRLRLEAGA